MKNLRFTGVSFILVTLFCSFAFAKDLSIQSLLNNQVELKIPSEFTLMTEEMLKLKYPSERRPTVVFTNESGGINVALNHTQNKANQDLIPAYQENFAKVFKNQYSSATWISKGVKNINGKEVGYLEFITPAIDTKIYNMMFFTDVDNRLLLCTFNCTISEMNSWSSTAKEIMESLKVK